jgi:hypothetical protein
LLTSKKIRLLQEDGAAKIARALQKKLKKQDIHKGTAAMGVAQQAYG